LRESAETMPTHMDHIKLVVVGDSGVGKSSFIKGIINQAPVPYLHSTIGCNVEILAYPYSVRHNSDRDIFLEFWEVGVAQGHRHSRSIFYNNLSALILVHDLSNRKSFLNLKKWLKEVMNSGKQELTGVSVRGSKDIHDFHLSSNTGSIPILVVGTKDEGLIEQNINRSALHIGLSEDSDIFFLEIDTLAPNHLLASSSKWNVLNTFFDKVIGNKFCVEKKNIPLEYGDHWRGRKR